ncbi:hypothetical protein NPIL_477631 [Nephila pilipes]|uniref:Uncharacterized protein n=1 Tax=Nephila pilipes TaxID=299642 RepID=A0A8X6U797_NEPPI|nr:hypothetical protein NPIL_477631 [Nephila pilipes]
MTFVSGNVGSLDIGLILTLISSGTKSIIRWAVISFDIRSSLVIVRGRITFQLPVDDASCASIPYRESWCFVSVSNSRPRTARIFQNSLDHAQILLESSRSPNLSAVENVWEQIKHDL